MNQIYNLRVNGYIATAIIEIDNEVLELDVDFNVYNPNGDVSIDIISVEAWNGHAYINIEDLVDLETLADDIVAKGDVNAWIEDAALDSFT